MALNTQKALFERRWALARLLHQARYGKTVAGLCEGTGASRATLYRDLDFLKLVGMPIVVDLVNGEARYGLLGDPNPALVSPMRRAAMGLACEALGALRGTRLHQEMERLRDELPLFRRVGEVRVLGSGPARGVERAVAEVVERALVESRELELAYRGANDAEARRRRVAALELSLVKGQVYLEAHDLDLDEARMFKLARVTAARVGPPMDAKRFPRRGREGSVGVWSGGLVEVTVRLGPGVARFAGEYPLVAGQVVEAEPGGEVVVRGRVAGLEEVTRWVLSWGAGATVLGPVELVAKVRGELARALGGYEAGAEGVREGVEGVSSKVRRGGPRVAKVASGQGAARRLR